MNRRELRQRMREQKKALRQSMAALRKQARERLDANPQVRKARARRRLQRLVGVALLLLLVSFLSCECDPAPPPPPAVVEPEPAVKEVVQPKPPSTPKKKQKPITGKIDPKSRGQYQGDAPPSPSWLDDFRLQVAARSPRLSECFKGAERPGALRWTTAVNPKSGAVSDQELEPQGPGPGLEFDQITCLRRVLSSPPYRLKAVEPTALPDRVGIVIEF